MGLMDDLGNLGMQFASGDASEADALAQQAAAKNPSIGDAAAGFYAQQPTLVKTIGAGALALLMSRLSASRR